MSSTKGPKKVKGTKSEVKRPKKNKTKGPKKSKAPKKSKTKGLKKSKAPKKGKISKNKSKQPKQSKTKGPKKSKAPKKGKISKNKSKQPKQSKTKGPKKSKAPKKSGKGGRSKEAFDFEGKDKCDNLQVFYYIADLKSYSGEMGGSGGLSTVGQTVDELPIYYNGQKQAGFLTEAAISTGSDCSYTGVISLNPDKMGQPSNQIFYQGSCTASTATAVTGGTGDFICASGIAEVAKRTEAKVFLDIQVCNSC
jgi:hypothetical protein